jgi:hypothetical protein
MINVPHGLTESQRNLYIAAYNRCVELKFAHPNQDIADIVRQVVSDFSPIISSEHNLKDFLFEEISAEIEPVINIISDEMKCSDWWKQLKKTPDFHSEYWTRYFGYLLKKDNWSINAVRDIDEATDGLGFWLRSVRQNSTLYWLD